MKKTLAFLLITIPLCLGAKIYTLRFEGPIDPLLEEYAVNSLQKVRQSGDARMVVIEMDTPGGFDTSMRSIIKAMLNAGAHPVSITGSDIEKTMKEKVTNDAVSYIKALARNRGRNEELAEKAVRESKSYTAEECLKGGLIDLVAADTKDLIGRLQGKTISLASGSKVTLDLHAEKIVPLEMSERQKFLRTITNPNLAYFLLIFGLAGLFIEFTHPGSLIPGILGGISLLLAFLAFQVLPINYVGLLLILLSIGFFIAEIKVQGFGILGVGGILSFILGSIVLINSPIPEMRPAMSMIITFALCFACIFLFLTWKVFRAMKRRRETGVDGIIGERGIAKTDIDGLRGKVFVHGEWWNAVADGLIPAGSRIQVESVDNLVLKVKKSGG
jgi:membrane-bound serine protease (ClpP class)